MRLVQLSSSDVTDNRHPEATVCPERLARPIRRDSIDRALSDPAVMPPRVLEDLVAAAAGLIDLQPGLSRSSLQIRLLRSDAALTDAHIGRLLDNYPPLSLEIAQLMLDHPVTGRANLFRLLGVTYTSHGRVRTLGAREWGREEHNARAQNTSDWLLRHPDRRTRVAATLRSRGITAFHPNWEADIGLLRGSRIAERNWRAAMARVDAAAERDASVWDVLEYLAQQRHRLGPADVEAAISTVT